MISNKRQLEIKLGLKDSDLEIIYLILSQEPTVEQAIVFGSRAKGNFKNGSDLDIALKGKELDFDAISKISYILNEETSLPYTFDILNYNSIKEPALIEHIDRIGISFYKKAEF